MSNDVAATSSASPLNETQYLFHSEAAENVIGCAMILCSAVIGILANGLSSFLLLRLSTFRNAFGLLATCQSIANTVMCIAFAFWAAPTVLLGVPENWGYVNHFIGQIAIYGQTTTYHAAISISVNRLMALASPYSYRVYFSYKNTLILIVVINLLSFAYNLVYVFGTCTFYFEASSMVWMFGNDDCSLWITDYIDFYWSVLIYMIAAIIDIFTLILLRTANVKLTNSRLTQSDKTSDAMRRQKKEVIFFIQSFISTVSYCFVLFSFHVIATLDVVISSRFVTFIFTTFIWTSGHASEGVILIIFNTEIKRRIFHPSKLLNSKSDTIMPTVVGAKTSNISSIQGLKSSAGLALIS